jgi:ABC-type sugar transport system permease subunit
MSRSWKTVLPFLLPFTAIFLVFLFYPAVYSIYLSFRKATIYTDLTRIFADMTWAGFENYKRLLDDKQFFWSLLMTAYYAVLVIPFGTGFSLLLAALLSNKLPGARFFRAAFYLPNVLDLFVIAVVWTAIYAPTYGVIDQLTAALGLGPIFDHGILADPWWAMPGIALMVILKNSGFGMILYLAAIQNIPIDVYEASDIDGATAWQKLTRITIPLVKHVTLLLIVTGILGSLMAFSEIYALTQGRPFESIPSGLPYFGGTTQGTTMLSGFYLFQKFYVSQDYGYAAALSVALLIISLPLSAVAFFAFQADAPPIKERITAFFRKNASQSSSASVAAEGGR